MTTATRRRPSRSSGSTITITRTIEIDVEIDLEVSAGSADHYDRSIGGPGGWSPGSAAEAEILEVRSSAGAILRIADELTAGDVAAIIEQAIEELGSREDDAREAAEEDAADARRERRMLGEDY